MMKYLLLFHLGLTYLMGRNKGRKYLSMDPKIFTAQLLITDEFFQIYFSKNPSFVKTRILSIGVVFGHSVGKKQSMQVSRTHVIRHLFELSDRGVTKTKITM